VCQNYQSWWKFDEVLTLTILHSFFGTRGSTTKDLKLLKFGTTCRLMWLWCGLLTDDVDVSAGQWHHTGSLVSVPSHCRQHLRQSRRLAANRRFQAFQRFLLMLIVLNICVERKTQRNRMCSVSLYVRSFKKLWTNFVKFCSTFGTRKLRTGSLGPESENTFPFSSSSQFLMHFSG